MRCKTDWFPKVCFTTLVVLITNNIFSSIFLLVQVILNVYSVVFVFDVSLQFLFLLVQVIFNIYNVVLSCLWCFSTIFVIIFLSWVLLSCLVYVIFSCVLKLWKFFKIPLWTYQILWTTSLVVFFKVYLFYLEYL